MLDDRNVTADLSLEPYATWTYDDNLTAWTTVLGEARGGPDVQAVAAPARLETFEELAAAYIEVGDLDIFRDEDIAYAQNLAHAGVPVELRVHPGAPRGFERLAPNSRLARLAIDDRTRVLDRCRRRSLRRPARGTVQATMSRVRKTNSDTAAAMTP
jgi:acetyl esterase/lipase